MVVMAAPVRDATLRPGREPSAPWSVDDLAALPDDGLRYELIDGALLVSPSPKPRHQLVSHRLAMLLDAACAAEQRVFAAPLDWQPGADRSFQPDLLVVPVAPLDGPLPAPVLVVEILSPSTKSVDRVLKMHAYAAAGVPQYWIVDPGLDGAEPSIEVYDLIDGTTGAAYRLQGQAAGDEALHVAGPVPTTVIPASLLR